MGRFRSPSTGKPAAMQRLAQNGVARPEVA